MKAVTKALLFFLVLALFAPGCSGFVKVMQGINDAYKEARIKQSEEEHERYLKFDIITTCRGRWQSKKEAHQEARRKKIEEEIDRSFTPPPAGVKDLNITLEAMQ